MIRIRASTDYLITTLFSIVFNDTIDVDNMYKL